MTRQRINLRIGRVVVRDGELSEQALGEAIRAELAMRLHGLGAVAPPRGAIAVVDAGTAEGTGGEGGGVGEAIGRATAGVLKP